MGKAGLLKRSPTRLYSGDGGVYRANATSGARREGSPWVRSSAHAALAQVAVIDLPDAR